MTQHSSVRLGEAALSRDLGVSQASRLVSTESLAPAGWAEAPVLILMGSTLPPHTQHPPVRCVGLPVQQAGPVGSRWGRTGLECLVLKRGQSQGTGGQVGVSWAPSQSPSCSCCCCFTVTTTIAMLTSPPPPPPPSSCSSYYYYYCYYYANFSKCDRFGN